MTDRELLERAARAAGWSWWQSKHGYWNVTAPDGSKHTACQDWAKFDSSTGEELTRPTPADALCELMWNPLEDDGDALRLAVRLQLVVAPLKDQTAVYHFNGPERGDTPHDGDRYAATRRAIVRAAAALGGE